MDRRYSYFVSDVHLGLQLMDADGRERRFVSFLRSLDPSSTEGLYLLGDIFDFWYEYKHVVPKGFNRVFAALQDLVDRGVKVFFMQGNHDIWTYHYFEDLGMTVLPQPWHMTIGGRRFCIGHGDGLGPVSTGYRLMNGAFRNKVLQALFSCLHPTIAFAFGNSWSASRRRKHLAAGPYAFRGKDEPLWKFAEAEKAPDGSPVDIFIFGHLHSHVDVVLGSGARFLMTRDWLPASEYVVFDSVTLTCEIMDCGLA
ncbi:MAG: UDP-2,3-diacylglucosamine diphosphatase [Bacteroidales bacterium]|nr:UDP-2,3-diacylglucosamine diphosphatase [Bacteroidales bacterium]